MTSLLLFWVPLTLVLLVKFRALKAFDELMEKVYTHHPEAWARLGRPIGYFWRPDDAGLRWMDGVAARLPITRNWLRRTPTGFPEESPIWLSLATWRATTLLSWLGFLIWVGVAVARFFGE